MIFVTVGTHEQQFNRLIREVDDLKGKGLIEDDVMIQTGYSTYEPKYSQWAKLIPYEQMLGYIKAADIVITHGGPSSFIMPLQIGKIPVVVPRQYQFKEHVNNHQLEFALEVKERYGNIIVVEHIEDLQKTLNEYKAIAKKLNGSIENNNKKFNESLEELVSDLIS